MHKFPYRPKCGTCHDRRYFDGCDRRDNDCRGTHDCGRGRDYPRDHERDCRRDCERRPPPPRRNNHCCNDLLIGVLIGTMLGDCCHRGGDRHDR